MHGGISQIKVMRLCSSRLQCIRYTNLSDLNYKRHYISLFDGLLSFGLYFFLHNVF